MERQPQPRERKKDRTGVFISTALHVLVIGLIAYFVSKTEFGQQIIQRTIGGTREKKEEEKPKPPPAKPIDRGKLKPPPGAPPPSKARAADAPAAAGESFFTEDKAKAERDAAAARAAGPKIAVPVAPPAYKPPPKVFSTAPSSIKQLLEQRAKGSAVVESFGSEQISKSGVSDVGDIVGRISGATVAEGKFAVVRGLADRYTLSTLNGVDIPSADPDRRAVQLDLFPAQFLNRVDVHKTFQPDLPGGFAGGAVDIITRSFPDRPIFSLSVGGAYNSQSSFRDDFLKTDHGGLDWLAMDNGKRELPPEAAATSPSADFNRNPLPERLKNSFGSRQFAPIEGDSPLNSSMSLAFGDTTHFLGRPLGFLAGINYKQDYNHYKDGRVAKVQPPGTDPDNLFDEEFVDARSTIEYTWGALATLAYRIFDNHELSFNFMYVQTAEDEARRLQGHDSDFGSQRGESYVDKSILHWTERNLNNVQLKGQHLFPELNDIRLDWVGSVSGTSQDEPDHRIFQFLAFTNPPPPNYNPAGPAQPPRPTRIFRELHEDNTSFRMDLTVPLSHYGAREHTLKTGLFVSESEQTYFSRVFEIRSSTTHPFYTNGNPNIFLERENSPFYEYHNFLANFQYKGEQKIEAAYLMGNIAPLDWFRLVGGARVEATDINVTTANPTRGTVSSSAISQEDLLPAVSASILLRSNLQFRAAWSQTIIRPTYREISEAELYDVARGRTIKGNTNLTMSSSENVDVRLEWYPRPGEIISVGAFMKKIDSPIELAQEDINGNTVFYNNYEKADVFGVELELRKNFRGFWGAPYDQFSLGFNYAYIKSEVPRTEEQKLIQQAYAGATSDFRPLYDQPEYVLNADLTWDCFLSGTSITIQGGVVGRRLVLIGYGTPDEYEEPAPQLEFSISQRLGRFWKLKFSGKNLLDPVYETTQDWRSGRITVESYTKGMQFGLSLGCDF